MSGTLVNDGLLFEQAEASVTFFSSSEGATLALRPQLDDGYPITCEPGPADCGGNGANGGATTLTTLTSCGACRVVCDDGNACTTESCATAHLRPLSRNRGDIVQRWQRSYARGFRSR